MKITPVELQAGKLSAVINSSNYQETIGAWLDEQRDLALKAFCCELDDKKMYRHQGQYQLIDTLKLWIDAVMSMASAAANKRKELEKNNE